MLKTSEDKQEFIKIVESEPSLFENIVVEYQKEIINFHFRFTSNRADAEDLAQDTFIKAYKKLHTLRDYEKLKSWLFSIARKTSIDHYRKNKNREIPIDSNLIVELAVRGDNSSSLEIMTDRNSANYELRKCMNSLSKEDKLIIELLYYYEFSYKEISEILDINKNTLKSRLYRARKSLFALAKENPLLKESYLQ